MAKQTLDLYELYQLVVGKGGLVEVINKKLWREITKGLNLPSSITSAAFTLRTQYMKYLYPYECEHMKLSSPSELQSAIDGNRREGRRPSYGYDFTPSLLSGPLGVPNGPTLTPGHLGGPLTSTGHLTSHMGVSPAMGGGHVMGPAAGMTAVQLHHANMLNTARLAAAAAAAGHSPLASVKDEFRTCHSPLINRSMAEQDARAMEAAARAMDLAHKNRNPTSASLHPSCLPVNHAGLAPPPPPPPPPPLSTHPSLIPPPSLLHPSVGPQHQFSMMAAAAAAFAAVSNRGGVGGCLVPPLKHNMLLPLNGFDRTTRDSEPPAKRMALDGDLGPPSPSPSEQCGGATTPSGGAGSITSTGSTNAGTTLPQVGSLPFPLTGMPSAHFKITSRNDGRSDFDNSLVVSMEVNGIMYQGVLFAQQGKRI